jgi:hypothetical protein
MIFDVKKPDCYKNLSEKSEIYEEFKLADGQAEMFTAGGSDYKILIQVRHNPKQPRPKISKEDFAKGIRHVLKKEFVLPYGLLIKEKATKKIGESLTKIPEEGTGEEGVKSEAGDDNPATK